jgi:hypothetical protein
MFPCGFGKWLRSLAGFCHLNACASDISEARLAQKAGKRKARKDDQGKKILIVCFTHSSSRSACLELPNASALVFSSPMGTVGGRNFQFVKRVTNRRQKVLTA